MGPQENLTWNHGYPPKDHESLPKLTLIHNTTHHGPHMARHPVPYQDFIHTRYLDYNLYYLTNVRGSDGWTHTNEGGGLIPMPRGLP